MNQPMSPEIKESERNPYKFIDEYVDELFRDLGSYSVGNLRGVSDSELHLLEPRYPLGGDYVRPKDLGEQSFEPDGTSLLNKLVFNALTRSRKKHQRVSTSVPFATTHSRRHLADNSIDFMLEIKRLQLEGVLTIDGEAVAFSPENRLITIQALDSDAHNGGARPQDKSTYYYLPFRKELFAEPEKGNRHPDTELSVPLISNEKSDIENIRALFEQYSTNEFYRY
jgi:hypothetical protein